MLNKTLQMRNHTDTMNLRMSNTPDVKSPRPKY